MEKNNLDDQNSKLIKILKLLDRTFQYEIVIFKSNYINNSNLESP